MKNVITKLGYYKDISYFIHIYFLDVDYEFNEKSIDDVLKFVNSEPFFEVLIHTNDITLDVVHTIKEISKIKTIWLQSDTLLFEDLAVMDKEALQTLGLDQISVMIDALDDIIDLTKTLKEEELIRYNYDVLPF